MSKYNQYALAREMHPDKSAKELILMRDLDGLHALRERSIRRNKYIINDLDEIKRLGAKDFKKAKEFCDKMNAGEIRLNTASDITIGEAYER